MKSYASCSLFTVDDDLRSIFSNNSAVGFATASRYGIGLNLSRLRATNAPIRNGEVMHTGPIPFAKAFESTVKSCHQNGIRGGSATVNFAWFHYDILDILVLKNNQGTDDNRVRKLDYCVGLDKLIFERFIKNQEVTLFSYHECPSLWNSFGLPDFKEKYEKAEANKNIKFKKKVPARELMGLLAKERLETGRIYTMFVDHANEHGSWLDQVDTSNLCLEVNHPLIPIYDVNDPNGEIALCILSAINVGKLKTNDELESLCDLSVRSLDELIDFQGYPVKAAEISTKARRSLGIGYIGLAHYLAKHGVKYEDPQSWQLVHDLTEAFQYYLILSTANLAKEKGACEYSHRTKYAQGILPIDTYKKDVDEIVPNNLKYDWNSLRELVKTYGVRNSTLSAQMPSESSSVVSNATNGIEPPRGYLSVKKSKKGPLKQIVPQYQTFKNNYTLLWDMPDNNGYINIVAVMQKFFDQAISGNWSYNPENYPDNEVPVSVMAHDLLNTYRYGWKTSYYQNTYDIKTDEVVEEKPKVLSDLLEELINSEEESCESCAI